MHRGLGHQPEPPTRPRWEWWKYPACWAVIVAFVLAVAAAVHVSSWWWFAAAGIAAAVAAVTGLYLNDTGRRR